jgi:hypothetical protein
MPWLPLLPEAMSVAVNRITDRHSLLRNLLHVSSEMMSSVCLAGKVNSFLFCSKRLGDKEPGRQVAHRLLGAGFTKVTMASLLIGHILSVCPLYRGTHDCWASQAWGLLFHVIFLLCLFLCLETQYRNPNHASWPASGAPLWTTLDHC